MIALNESELRDLLFVRAFEEGDPNGELLSRSERDAATRDARAELASVGHSGGGAVKPEELVARRAKNLRAKIESRHHVAGKTLEVSGRAGPAAWLAFALAFALGAIVDRLGAEGKVNLLSFPILGLLAWNVGVYLMLLVSGFGGSKSPSKHKTSAHSEGAASRAARQGPFVDGFLWLASPQRFWRSGSARKADAGPLSVCLQRYLRDWLRIGAPLHIARAKRWMHLGAAGVMLGAISGMYVRGLYLQYDASWESTFLSASSVHALLEVLFGPAAWLLGQPMPSVEAIDALRAPAGSGSAALWIHYYAITGAIYVLVPRCLLALCAWRRTRILKRSMPFDLEGDAYFLKMLAVDRGQGRRAFVQAYSYHPSVRASEGLTTLLLDVLGGRTRVEKLPASEYGDPPTQLADTMDASAVCRVVLFTLAQSPEDEVHGAYLAEVLNELRARKPQGSLLVVLDQSPLLARLPRGEEAEERIAERTRSWARVLNHLGLEGVVCALDGRSDPTVLERARAALYPELAEGGAA